MEQSDYILYHNISDLQFKDKRTNDLFFKYQMSQSLPRCFIDREKEHQFWLDNYKSKIPTCNDLNNCNKEPLRPCPEYSKYFLNEFLLFPCPKPTHKNYLVCDKEKCCSQRHQLFKNITKRKDLTPK